MKRMMVLALGLAMGISFSVSAFAAEETTGDVVNEEIIFTEEQFNGDEGEGSGKDIIETGGWIEIDGKRIETGNQGETQDGSGESYDTGSLEKEKATEKDWRPNWMDAEKNSAEEAVIREYSPSDADQNPLSYLLDNYNCNLGNNENVYRVVPEKIYILKKNTPSSFFDELEPLELVIVNRVYEADRIFGTKRTVDVTLISTGQRLNVPIGDSAIAVYTLHRIYKVEDPKYSQNIRDLLEWER